MSEAITPPPKKRTTLAPHSEAKVSQEIKSATEQKSTAAKNENSINAEDKQLHLVAVAVESDRQHIVSPPAWADMRTLTEVLSNIFDIPLELVEVVAPNGIETKGRQLVSACGMRNGDQIQVVRLPKPPGYDLIGECSECEHARHVFYSGWSRSRGEWEPVTAKCHTCGGRPHRAPDEYDTSDDSAPDECHAVMSTSSDAQPAQHAEGNTDRSVHLSNDAFLW